jgi:hypothetical protein
LVEGERQEGDIDLSNDEWFKENYADLVQKYPRLWIAVLDQQVICDGGTKREVGSKASGLVGDREFSIYFVEPTTLPL